MKNVLVTGYRAHELQIFDQKNKAIPFIKKAFRTKIISIIEEGAEWIITPGQYGFDLWASEVIIELREEQYPHIKLSMLTAFANQEENWKDERKEYYQSIKDQVDFYAEVSKQPYVGPWQFQARDQLLFHKTDGMVLFYDEEAAPSNMKFVKERAAKLCDESNYTLIIITADDIQNAMEVDYDDIE